MNALVSGCLLAFAWILWHPPEQMVSRQLRALNMGFAAKPSLGVILEMMTVAMREGSSIPHALEVIGTIVGGALGGGLCRVSRSLMQGFSWEDAWFAALLACQKTEHSNNQRIEPDVMYARKHQNDDDDSPSGDVAAALDALNIIEDALKNTWIHGVSPVGPLESAVEQLDARERASIEQSAQRLSVKLLLPTGLCFLPSFMLIGIIPAIGSFIGR